MTSLVTRNPTSPDAGAAPEAAATQAAGEGLGREHLMAKVTDAQYLEFGPWTLDLSPLSVPPIHVPPVDVGGLFLIPGLEIDLSVTKHVVFLFLASILTIVTMWVAARRARRLEESGEAPRGFQNFVEVLYIYLRDEVALRNIGKGGEPYVPYVVTLFFFILYANLLGLVPGGATATTNIMVTGGLAFLSLVLVEATGFRELGTKGYLNTIFYAPPGLHPVLSVVLRIIMAPVELLGKITKHFALAIRLFATMTAGSFILLSLIGLILAYGSFTALDGLAGVSGSLGLGLFVMFLEMFIKILQAYIFTILTAVFVGLIRHAH